MQTPEVVAQCVDAMRQASDIPVSVKSRIGVDDMESYEQLSNFVTQIENAGYPHTVPPPLGFASNTRQNCPIAPYPMDNPH
jgi:hypothetical protein